MPINIRHGVDPFVQGLMAFGAGFGKEHRRVREAEQLFKAGQSAQAAGAIGQGIGSGFQNFGNQYAKSIYREQEQNDALDQMLFRQTGYRLNEVDAARGEMSRPDFINQIVQERQAEEHKRRMEERGYVQDYTPQAHATVGKLNNEMDAIRLDAQMGIFSPEQAQPELDRIQQQIESVPQSWVLQRRQITPQQMSQDGQIWDDGKGGVFYPEGVHFSNRKPQEESESDPTDGLIISKRDMQEIGKIAKERVSSKSESGTYTLKQLRDEEQAVIAEYIAERSDSQRGTVAGPQVSTRTPGLSPVESNEPTETPETIEAVNKGLETAETAEAMMMRMEQNLGADKSKWTAEQRGNYQEAAAEGLAALKPALKTRYGSIDNVPEEVFTIYSKLLGASLGN